MHRCAVLRAGLLSIALLSGSAYAADLPARMETKAPPIAAATFDWSGFYIGLDGGGASSHECWTVYSVAGVPVFPNPEGCHTATGGLFGGQGGYRWQVTHWVFGV